MITNLIFSGCSTKFFIILGCLKCLLDYKYIDFKNIDNILCSSGSVLIILYYLLGYTLTEIKDIILGVELHKVFFNNRYNIDIVDNIYNYNCIINNKRLKEVLKIIIKNKYGKDNISFMELYNMTNICLIINVYCFDDDKIEYLSYKTVPNMDIVEAILMTTAIPILFQPVIYNGKTYCDPCIKNQIDLDYFFTELNPSKKTEMLKKTLCILIESDKSKYNTQTNINDENRIDNIIKYISRVFYIITDLSRDYKEYNVINFKSSLKFYDLEVKNEIKNKLILLGFIKTYDYIKLACRQKKQISGKKKSLPKKRIPKKRKKQCKQQKIPQRKIETLIPVKRCLL